MTTSEESRSLPFKLLNRDNFSEWKASMESALCEKELWSYVEDAGGDVKHVKNASARGYIMRRIEHQQREHVKPGLNAHGVWRALCDAHEKQGPQTELRFFNTLMATRYVDGTRMEDHLSTMKELFDRLHALGSPFREHIRASMILSTLPPSWSAIAATQTALVSDSNPLTVASVSHVLLEEQTRRATAAQRAQHIESAAALLVSASSSTQSRAPRKKCTWCLNLNHTEDECRGKAAGKPLGHKLDTPTVLYSDNQGSIALSKNPDSHRRSKHIDVKFHLLREHVEKGTVALQYVNTKDMPADVLTKVLPRSSTVTVRAFSA